MTAKDLETEMRQILAPEIHATVTTTVTDSSGYVATAYAVPPTDLFPGPGREWGAWGSTPVELLRLIVGLETQLAEVRKQVADLALAFENRDVVEGWNLSREQFIELAEAAHKIISGVTKPKRVRKRTPKST